MHQRKDEGAFASDFLKEVLQAIFPVRNCFLEEIMWILFTGLLWPGKAGCKNYEQKQELGQTWWLGSGATNEGALFYHLLFSCPF